MLRTTISRSRFIALVAVVCVFIAATVLAIYGAIDTINIIVKLLQKGSVDNSTAKSLIFDFIELVDLFLLATVFYVVSIGLYELFIDDNLPVPDWMSISDLDDLKDKLIAVVIVVLGVTYLGQVISGTAPQDLFWSGAGMAFVITALTFFLRQNAGDRKDKTDTGSQP